MSALTSAPPARPCARRPLSCRPARRVVRTGAAGETVYVVSTDADDVFAVHRLDPRKDTYSTRVLAFREREPAAALATGLEAYRRVHGGYPPRDQGIRGMNLLQAMETFGATAEPPPPKVVRVRAVGVDHLVDRFRGTGVMLTLLSHAGAAARVFDDKFGEEPVDEWAEPPVDGFEWENVPVDQGAWTVVDSLDRSFYGEGNLDGSHPEAVPCLLPKPRRRTAADVDPLDFTGAALMAFQALVFADEVLRMLFRKK